MEFEDVKKTVNEIDILKNNLNNLLRLHKWNVSEILCPELLKILQEVELENNTRVLLKESAEKHLFAMMELLEYELGERMKKLNIVDDEKHLRKA